MHGQLGRDEPAEELVIFADDGMAVPSPDAFVGVGSDAEVGPMNMGVRHAMDTVRGSELCQQLRVGRCRVEIDNPGHCVRTGGGVVETEAGPAQVVLFASRLEEGDPGAAGFVRWIATVPEPITLESVGPITYEVTDEDSGKRTIRGTMQANGDGSFPFVLLLNDAGPDAIGEDTVDLAVGASVEDSGSRDFGYDATGSLTGGDLQLLGSVAPIARA